jgi:hypothetical protein
MAEIGTRSGKVKPGMYRCAEYVIERVGRRWHVSLGGCRLCSHSTLSDAYGWCRRNTNS